MSGRALIHCRTSGCAGVLGTFANGEFIPSAHLLGGRDWRVTTQGQVMAVKIRCSLCGAEYAMIRVADRLTISLAA